MSKINAFKIGGGLYLYDRKKSHLQPTPTEEGYLNYLKQVVKPASLVRDQYPVVFGAEYIRTALSDENMGHFIFDSNYSEYNDEYDPQIEKVENSEQFGALLPFIDYFLSIYPNEDKFLDILEKYQYNLEASPLSITQIMSLIAIQVNDNFILDGPLIICLRMLIITQKFYKKDLEQLEIDSEEPKAKETIEKLITKLGIKLQ